MLLVATLGFAQDVGIHDPLTTGSTATTVYGGSFTGAGWRVDDENSRLTWDFGTQVERGTLTFTTSGIDTTNLTGDNNEFVQLFDAGDKWSCTRAVEFRVYGSDDGDQQGDVKLKTWDNGSGLYSEDRGGVQVWDGAPHTWTITWDTATATLSRDGTELVALDVSGQDLRVGTLWLPLNTWGSGYSHPIGSVYSDLSFEGWEPGGGGGDTDTGQAQEGGYVPIEDVNTVEANGDGVAADTTDLSVQDSTERSYLMWDLSDLHGTVTSATLTLHARSDSHSSGDGAGVYAVADTSWDETTLSWTAQPVLGAQVGSFGAVTAGDTVVVDVTAGVTAGGRVALALANGGADGVHFSSKEGEAAPTLAVVVVDDGSSGGGGGGGGGGDTGDGTVDGTGGSSAADTDALEAPGTPKDPGGCGCATGSGGGVGIGLLGGIVGFVRRRRGERG